MKTPERRCSSAFILNIKEFSHRFLSISNFEQVIFCWKLPFNFAITKICVAISLTDDGTRMGGIKFQPSPIMLNIEILISLNLRPVFFIILFFFFYSLSFVFPLLTKSISVKKDYKASCAILLQGQIETAAIFFRIHDKWLRGY